MEFSSFSSQLILPISSLILSYSWSCQSQLNNTTEDIIYLKYTLSFFTSLKFAVEVNFTIKLECSGFQLQEVMRVLILDSFFTTCTSWLYTWKVWVGVFFFFIIIKTHIPCTWITSSLANYIFVITLQYRLHASTSLYSIYFFFFKFSILQVDWQVS